MPAEWDEPVFGALVAVFLALQAEAPLGFGLDVQHIGLEVQVLYSVKATSPSRQPEFRKKLNTNFSSLSLAENSFFSSSSVWGLTGFEAKLSFASRGPAIRIPFARKNVLSVWKML